MWFFINIVFIIYIPENAFSQNVSLPDTAISEASSISIPIFVDDLTDKNIYNYDYTITFDPAIIKPTGTNKSGTLSSNLLIVSNTTVSGQIKVAAAGFSPLQGEGIMLYNTFEVITTEYDSTELRFSFFQFGPYTYNVSLKNGNLYVGHSNQAPAISAMSDTVINEGSDFTRQIVAIDPEGDPINFSLISAPNKMVIDSTSGLITYTPLYTQAGSYYVNVRAEDSNGGEDTESFNLTVNNINVPPAFVDLTDTTAVENVYFSRQLHATDLDDNTLIHSMLTFPDGVAINTTTGLIEWIPTFEQAGLHQVSVIVKDSDGLSDTTSFSITVGDKNRPPFILKPIKDYTLPEDFLPAKIVNLSKVFSDSDQVSLEYKIIKGDSFVSILNNKLYTDLPLNYFGTEQIIVQAEDDSFTAVSNTFNLIITPVNDSPTIISSPDTIVTARSKWSYQVVASDVDPEDILVYSLIQNPLEMTIDSMSGLVEWTPTNKDIGTKVISVSVKDDGAANVNQTFTLLINDYVPIPKINKVTYSKEGKITIKGKRFGRLMDKVFINGKKIKSKFIKKWQSKKIIITNYALTKGKYEFKIFVNGIESNIYLYKVKKPQNLSKKSLLPNKFLLSQNYPNPFNPTTEINYIIPEVAYVNLSIFNPSGVKIKTLTNENKNEGSYKILWDGTNEMGFKVGSGIYFYRIKAGKFIKVKKMILLR